MSSLAGAARLTMGAVWTGFTEDFGAASAEDRCAPGRQGLSTAAVDVATQLVAASALDYVVCDKGGAEMTASAAPRICSIVRTADGCAAVSVATANEGAPGTAWS